jgi:hypothetical protein
MENNELKKRIMRRVYAGWFFKRMAPALVFYMPFLLAVMLWETGREFFVAKIVENFTLVLHRGFWPTLNYVVSAVTHTRAMPVLIILVSLAVFVILLGKVLRGVKEIRLARNY